MAQVEVVNGDDFDLLTSPTSPTLVHDASAGLVPERNEAGKEPRAAAAGVLSAARVGVDGSLDVVK